MKKIISLCLLTALLTGCNGLISYKFDAAWEMVEKEDNNQKGK